MGLLLSWGACEYGNLSALLEDGYAAGYRASLLWSKGEKLPHVWWELLPVSIQFMIAQTDR